MKLLLDTNVLSELRKGLRADQRVREWYASTAEDEKYISVLSLGEIRRGIEIIRSRDPKRAGALEVWLSGLSQMYADHLFGVDTAIAETWGRLSAAISLPVVDGVLAATALVHGLTVASRNVKDIARTGVPFVNPFMHTS